MIYSHLGYLLPYSNESLKWQPYVSFSNNDYDAFQQANKILGIGLNAYFSGHNSKLTLEYKNDYYNGKTNNLINLQAMIYL